MLLTKMTIHKRIILAASMVMLSACQNLPFSDKSTAVVKQAEACECVQQVVQSSAPIPSCPEVVAIPAKVAVKKVKRSRINDDALLIGRVENVLLLPEKIKIKARIDTGAGLSSLHTKDLITFERDGKPWVRFSIQAGKQASVMYERPVKRYISIKQHNSGPQRRPVVAMSYMLGSIEEQVDTTLTDRTEYLYQLLIGRNFLRDRAIVDVSKKFTVKIPK